MKVQFFSLSLGIVALAAAGSPAVSGEWSAQGIADYNRSVAVPAPMPIPVNKAQWYVRGDAAWVAAASGDVSSTGFPVNTFPYEGGDSSSSFGLAIGYYLTRNWRLEVAGDWTNDHTTSRNTEPVTRDVFATGPVTAGTSAVNDTLHYSGDFNHTTTMDSTAALLNLYYDMDTGSWFKPYIGGGLGLSVHRLRVKGETDLTCDNLDRQFVDDGDPLTALPVDIVGGSCGLAVNPAAPIRSRDGHNTITAYGLAATFMTGAAIEVSDGIFWDTGYRFIYRGGTAAVPFNGPTGSGTIEVEGRIDHEIRTGVRFDIF